MLTVQQIQNYVSDYFKDKPVKEAYLFGSYAVGKAEKESDIDILFSLVDGTHINYFGLAQYLIDLERILSSKVDLVEEKLVYPLIKGEIDRTKVLIYSK